MSELYAQAPLYSGVPVSDVSTNNGIGNANTSRNVAVGSNGDVHVVFTGDAGIRVASSRNRGMSFEPSVPISSVNAEPGIMVNGSGIIFVSFIQGPQILLSRSTNNGVSFSTPVQIGNSSFSSAAHLSYYQNNVYLTNTSGSTLLYNANQGIGAFGASQTGSSYVYADVLTDVNGKVFLPTDDPRLYLFESLDNGVTLTQKALVPGGSVFFSSYALSDGPCGTFIFTGGGGDPATSSEGFKIDVNTGTTTPITLASNSSSAQGRTLFADNRGTLVDGYRTASGDLSMNVSGDQGQTFGMPITIASGLSHNIARNPRFDDIDVVYSQNGQVFLSVYDGLLKNVRLEDPSPAVEYCAGDSIDIDFTLSGSFASNTLFEVLLSDGNGDFSNATQLGTTTTNTSGNLTLTLPSGLPSSTNYRCLIKSDANCLQSNTITIAIKSDDLITGPLSVCGIQTVQLTGSNIAAASNPWTSSNPAVATVSDTGLVTAIAPGTTQIIYTSDDSCGSAVETFSVFEQPTIIGGNLLCEGTSEQLSVTAGQGTAATWSSSDPTIATVDATGIVTGITAGTVDITFTGVNGCNDILTITVGTDASITGEDQLCVAETSQLMVSSPISSDVWTSSNPAIATVDNAGLVTAVAAGVATINFTNATGCQGTIDVTVTQPVVITGAQPICINDDLQLGFQGGSSTVQWTSSNPAVATIDVNGLIQTITVGVTTITAVDDNTCNDSVEIIVNALPEFALPQEFIVCLDEAGDIIPPVPVLDSGLDPALHSFEWSLDGQVIPGATDPSILTTAIGVYELTATFNATGCSFAASSNVVQMPPPILDAVVVGDDFSTNQTIVATTVGMGDYEYQINGGIWERSGRFTNLIDGCYTIIVRDRNGCGEDMVNLCVLSYPRFFTPNADGFNDTWRIPGFQPDQVARIYIFDRYGKLLKQLNGSQTSWDGTFNGELMPSSDYWFKVEYIPEGMTEEQTFNAHFSLKR